MPDVVAPRHAPTTAPQPKPLRPLMVVPDFDRVGGYELQALSLASHFARSGTPSFLVTNDPETGRPAREERLGVTLHRLPCLPPQHGNWAARFVAFLRFLESHRTEYDVIHCHALTFLAACCARIGRLLGKPVVVKVATEQDVREQRAGRGLHWRLFFRWLRNADRLQCLSEAIRREAIACGFREEQAVLAPNGVDTERFAPPSPADRAAARAAVGLHDGELAFVTVGRLVPRKGIDVLLDALARAGTAAARGARLLVVGDGPERAPLAERARALRLDGRVTFAGEQSDVRPWLHAADAFAFPSRREGLPNALLEALACGLPSVAARIGGCEDVLGCGCGILVPHDDVKALALALDELAADPARREALATAARARATDHFAFAVTASRLQRLYEDAARSRERILGGRS